MVRVAVRTIVAGAGPRLKRMCPPALSAPCSAAVVTLPGVPLPSTVGLTRVSAVTASQKDCARAGRGARQKRTQRRRAGLTLTSDLRGGCDSLHGSRTPPADRGPV